MRPVLRTRIIFLVMAFFAFAAVSSISMADSRCKDGVIERLRSLRGRGFDRTVFLAKKSEYKMAIAKDLPLSASPRTQEEKAALIEALAEAGHAPTDVSQSLADLESRKRVLKLLGKLDFKKGVTADQCTDFVVGAYRAVHGNPYSYRSMAKLQWKEGEREVIRERVVSELLGRPWVEAFDSLGLIREPGKVRQMRNRLKSHSNAVNMILGAIFNGPVIASGGAPFYLPKLSLSSLKKISPELKEKILTQGFDSVYADLKKQLGSSARFDLFWEWARKVYVAGITVVMTGVAFEEAHEKQVVQEQQESQLKELLLELEIKRFKEATGRDPSPEELAKMKADLS